MFVGFPWRHHYDLIHPLCCIMIQKIAVLILYTLSEVPNKNKTKQNKKHCFFLPKPSLGTHTIHSLSFGLRTPLLLATGFKQIPQGSFITITVSKLVCTRRYESKNRKNERVYRVRIIIFTTRYNKINGQKKLKKCAATVIRLDIHNIIIVHRGIQSPTWKKHGPT